MAQVSVHVDAEVVLVIDGVLKCRQRRRAQAKFATSSNAKEVIPVCGLPFAPFTCPVWRIVVHNQDVSRWQMLINLLDECRQVLDLVVRRDADDDATGVVGNQSGVRLLRQLIENDLLSDTLIVSHSVSEFGSGAPGFGQ